MKKTMWMIAVSFVCVFLILNCSQPSYDVVITGGTIVDGTGEPGYRADLGIKGGCIQAIGKIRTSRAREVIDALGKYVTPGFIDMHTHCENISHEQLKAGLNYLTQGVTTVVTGNCGSGTHNVSKYFLKLEEQGIGLNVVHLVGHGTVRALVLKNEDRAPSKEELTKMKSLVRQAMEEGAAGLSSGLFYAPGSYAEAEEVIALCDTVKEFDGIYATHIRDESTYTIGLEASIEEAIEIGEKAGIPVQISHIKALGKPVWGKSTQVCALIEEAQNRGARVYADQYPYSASSTSLVAAVVPRWVQADGKLRERLQDEALLSRIKEEMRRNIDRRGGAGTLVISSFPRTREWEGKSLEEISKILGISEVDTAIELIFQGGPNVISFNQSDVDVEYFMQKPYVMTGSDGQITFFGKEMPHPRNYGTFPRKIRRYVLEKKVLSMEQAIRSASGLPAQMLKFKDRGLIKESYVADVVIFDPARIADKATFEEPHQYSKGIDFVLISGKIVIRNGEFTGVLAGKPLTSRRQSDKVE